MEEKVEDLEFSDFVNVLLLHRGRQMRELIKNRNCILDKLKKTYVFLR